MVMDWIQGDRFIELAHYVFAPAQRSKDDYGKLYNTLHIGDEFWQTTNHQVPIVYTHTFYVQALFNILRFTKRNIILVTHNSDMPVSDHLIWPNRILKWYSTNVNYSCNCIESIPIGLENDRWFTAINKKKKMLELLQEKREIKNLLYINHNIKTNPAERKDPYDRFFQKGWTTIEHGTNGENFPNYITNVRSHYFVLCPAGNGLDTHRTWEALYMGAIPIEKRNINNAFYQDLPISFVDSWGDVTEGFLLSELQRIQNMKWDPAKLQFAYWKSKILAEWEKYVR